MNFALREPTSQNFPEVIEDFLEDGMGVTCEFNRRGTLLAVGCNDGRVVIWDFDTHGIARSLCAQIQTINSVSWSRNGKHLLSASTDCSVVLWDVQAGDILKKYKFESSVTVARMHPRNSWLLFACPMMSGPVLIDARKPDEQAKRPLPLEKEATQPNPPKKYDQGIVAAFNKRGDRIYIGTPRGKILVAETETLNLLDTIPAPPGTNCAIKSIRFDRKGQVFMVNSADKNIRVYRSSDHEMEHKFADLVNRIQWKTCGFSGASDYVVAGSAQESEHHIYIWDREKGNLLRILEGPKEGLLDVKWHPIRPVIASISKYGTVYIWSINYTENWSAFAPDFKELPENEEYIEREDEFDVVNIQSVGKKEEQYTENVDILTVDDVHFASSDEEPLSDDELIYLPAIPLDFQDAQEENPETLEPAPQPKKASASAKRPKAVASTKKRKKVKPGKAESTAETAKMDVDS